MWVGLSDMGSWEKQGGNMMHIILEFLMVLGRRVGKLRHLPDPLNPQALTFPSLGGVDI